MTVGFLVKYGADITAHDGYGSTPMHYMSESVSGSLTLRASALSTVNTKSQMTRRLASIRALRF